VRRLWFAVTLCVAALIISCGGNDDDAGGDGSGATDRSVVAAESAQPNGAGGTTTPGSQTAAAGPQTPQPTPTLDPEMTARTNLVLDADPATPAIESTASHGLGEEFQVSFVVASTENFYAGYQMHVGWDGAALTYVALDHLKPEGLETCSPTINPLPNQVLSFCIDVELRANTYTGPVEVIHLRCETPGTSTVEILSPSDSPKTAGTKMEGRGEGAKTHILEFDNVDITCL
jgi:hypothetical protein